MNNGYIQRRNLLLSSILRHAARHHGRAEVITHPGGSGTAVRLGYQAIEARCRRLAGSLRALGIGAGDRVSSLAWNDHRHFELYYGVTGIGAILNTINVRLSLADIGYVLENARSSALFVDHSLLPIVTELAPRFPRELRDIVVIAGPAEDLPLPAGIRVHAYEDLVDERHELSEWPDFDEDAACFLAYTSGTSGRPKGVLHSHRSVTLACYTVNTADMYGLRAVDRVLPAAQMYHAMGWLLPYCAPMVGATLVLTGRTLDGAGLYEILQAERVSMAFAVPTVWMGLLDHVESRRLGLDFLKRAHFGGAPVTEALMRRFETLGIRVTQSWGMTEAGPVGVFNAPTPESEKLTGDARLSVELKQGRPPFNMSIRIVDEAGAELAWDGKSMGRFNVSGPMVISRYFGSSDRSAFDGDWLDTGDVATIDPNGFVKLVDRTKDVIKSGGEWISSIEIENAVAAHAGVAEAAVVGIAHPKWGERPLLVIVFRPGARVDQQEILRFLEGKIANWWRPDSMVVVEALPRTSIGKIDKRELRAAYANLYEPSGGATD
ncbi:MAG: long-chain-fatty-acid--CoA ligase [Burkholderiaceae bacterium]